MKVSINRFIFLFVLSLVLLSLSACGAVATETPEPVDAFQDFKPVASATGRVIPRQWATLSVNTTGIIAELLVEENEQVAAGQPLLRMSGSEQLEAALTAAKLELVNAEQALANLEENAAVSATQALQTVADTRDMVRDAETRLNNLETNSPQVDIEQAKANVVLARDKLEKAQEDFEPYENKPETNVTRATYQSRLAQVQKEYDAAVRLLNNLQGTANEIDMDQAQADLAFSKALLEKALADYEKVKDGEPDPNQYNAAQARLENALAQVNAAEAALLDLTLEAPFAGTVSALYIRENEWVTLGQPVLLIGDLDHLLIETTDLNEIDVARIEVGSPAAVTFDALSEYTGSGTVTRIATKASEGSGVNYTVMVELDEMPPNLLWGMTAFVDIEVEE